MKEVQEDEYFDFEVVLGQKLKFPPLFRYYFVQWRQIWFDYFLFPYIVL
jgi:hypothetical protein